MTSRVAVAVALVAPPGIDTVGTEVYPDPAPVSEIELTPSDAVAAAFGLPVPAKLTAGTDV
jgi:hypothetical protein